MPCRWWVGTVNTRQLTSVYIDADYYGYDDDDDNNSNNDDNNKTKSRT